MKIAFIRYPEELYKTGRVIRGGSEIANQNIIQFLRSKGDEILEFSPSSEGRLELMEIPAVGTPLMFQGLQKEINAINQCDLVITTNWFGAILPEITKPIITIFHSNAKLVLKKNVLNSKSEIKVLTKWLKLLHKNNLLNKSEQNIHDAVISLEEAYQIKKSTGVIAVSKFLADSLTEDYSAKPQSIKVIHNPYPEAWRDLIPEKDYEAKELGLINVTRFPLDEDGFISKGIDRVFELFKKTRGFKKEMLASTKPGVFSDFMAKEFGDLVFAENVDRNLVAKKLSNSNISFHASRCEAFGLTLVESMMMGNVPIVFPTGVAEELIEDGKNGFIVNSVDRALAIIKDLNKDRKKLREVSCLARSTVLEKTDPELIGQQYRDFFDLIIKEDQSKRIFLKN